MSNNNKVVLYQRVSTVRQGHSGLGLEAQASACAAYVASVQAVVVGNPFIEVETGKLDARPELMKALALCKQTGATLVISRLDRLSRNAAFLMNLKASGVKFVATDMPQANDMTVGIMALVAQNETEANSIRTTGALKAAKARGTKLGNPNGASALRRADKGNTDALTAIKAKADKHAAMLKPVIDHLKSAGLASLGAIAKALNDGGMLTPRGGKWHKTSVSNLMARLAQPQ